MHGGREGEGRERRHQLRHMLPVPGTGTIAASSGHSAADSDRSPSDFFIKDGRKIQVGDCALFQAGNAPPFIGLIRWLAPGKDNYLKLGVNWLYRPADIKLVKGTSLEAAPNEVFYSFHRDEIPAVSLLHPCRVAFLKKGVELPQGISSFVCRRVYDIANKCLWWLTDQDYINERQEEVDQLIDRTRLEMHAGVQSGGRSPKSPNIASSTQQIKTGADSVQNSGTSFAPQVKSRKRERSDQGTEPIKRDRSSKIEDGDCFSSRPENMIKAEVTKLADKGGLLNIESVEKLVHLMQLDRAERKIDLGERILLADVIAATDRSDCLGRFVQLRGVPILDEWLQEAHRGKTGDASSPKESEKSAEELLFALLRALDKLPVNLNALQTCNIGKSVNYLRSHKNSEVQKKARSLVDTWKKRVDAEMTKMSDVKTTGSCQPVSWPVKSGLVEVPHGGHKRAGSTEIISKSPSTQPSTCKTALGKPGHVDVAIKSTSVAPVSLKQLSPLPAPLGNSAKDSHGKIAGSSGPSDLPVITTKEEKSSGSSQSQTNSQSCTSDHVKTVVAWKEEARGSSAGSSSTFKTSGGLSRHRRSSNGFVGTGVAGVQKDANLGKSVSNNRNTTFDKVSPSGLSGERPVEMPVADHGNSHRLIVRLPNPGRSPARTASGGSFEDPSAMGSRASSPGIPDKHDFTDRKTKHKGDACRPNNCTDANTDEGHESKEGLVVPAIFEEHHCRNADESGKFSEASRASCSSLGREKGAFPSEPKSRNSFSSINALIESCAKYSEAGASLSAGDDIGMNLLASVAAGEISKSDLASPTGSPGGSSAMEDLCTGNNESKSRSSCDEVAALNQSRLHHCAVIDSEKNENYVALPSEGLQLTGTKPLGGDEGIPLLHENKLEEQTEQDSVSSMSEHKAADSSIKCDKELKEERADRCVPASTSSADVEEEIEGNSSFPKQERCNVTGHAFDIPQDYKPTIPPVDGSKSDDFDRNKIAEGSGTSDLVFSSVANGNNHAPSTEPEKAVFEEPQQFTKSCIDGQKPKVVDTGSLSAACTVHQLPPAQAIQYDAIGKSCTDTVASSGAENPCSHMDKDLTEKSSSVEVRGQLELGDNERNCQTSLASSNVGDQSGSVHTSNGGDLVERKEAFDRHLTEVADREEPTNKLPLEGEHGKSIGSDLPEAGTDASLVVTAGPDIQPKIDFDLNEGFSGDEGNQSESVTLPVPVSSSAIQLPILSPFASPPMPNGSPALITVAAPAKGPFVPPEYLMRSKGEPGWKGSAATSAFRPAEPRRVLELPFSTSDVPSSDINVGKQGRLPLDIDLNVADERFLEDMASQSSVQTVGSESGFIRNRDASMRMAGGLDLDLNRVDESLENVQLLSTSSQRSEVPLMPAGVPSGVLLNGKSSLRDFDLNGPGVDEVGAESGMRNQHAKNSSVQLLPPVGSLRMNNAERGNVSAWFPPGSTYPAVAIPSFLTDRGEQPYPIVAAAGTQRILGPGAGGSTFGSDIYRGPMLSSSPSMAFSHASSFPYAGFPFGSSFPLASASFSGGSTTYVDSAMGGGPCYPTIPSQLVGPPGSVSSIYARPYVISLPEANSSGGPESSRKWGRQGFDLNAGPGSGDVEGREERLPSVTRQISVSSSQAFVEEQGRIYQSMSAGVKRKEPETGWDAERYAYKHPSWQ